MAKSLVKFFKWIRRPPLQKGKDLSGSTLYLPTELWFEILGHIADKHTLVCLTQVNRALCEVAEPTLYNAITLQWDTTEITKFRHSIGSCPRRAGYVLDIILTHIDKKDLRLRDQLSSLLNSLQSLRHLHIEEIPDPGTDCCVALSSVRLPELRTLVVSMESTSSILLDFLAAHQKLQEIDLRTSYIHDEPSKSSGRTSLSALRTLTCRTPFLNSDRLPIPPNLTHLYRPCFLLSHLSFIATHVGPRLVSLRLGNIFPFEDFQPWSLLDVMSKFPRLRFLHVDMDYTSTPGLDTRLIDWYQRRPAWFSPDLNERPRITLAWTYGEKLYGRHEYEAGWDRYLDDGATQVLQEWGGCVERVVYEVASGRYMSMALGTVDGVERQLVKTEDKNMHEDYWNANSGVTNILVIWSLSIAWLVPFYTLQV